MIFGEYWIIFMLWVYNFTIPPGTLKDSEKFKEMLERMANESESELGPMDATTGVGGPAEITPEKATSNPAGYKKRLCSDVEEGETEREEQTLIEQVKSRSKLEFQVFHFVQRPGHVRESSYGTSPC